jgi:hypothetical protein
MRTAPDFRQKAPSGGGRGSAPMLVGTPTQRKLRLHDFAQNAHSLRHVQAYDWWKHGSPSNGAKSRDRRRKPGSSTISQGLLEDRGGDKGRSPKATGGSVLAVGHQVGTGKAPRPRRVLIRRSRSRTLLRIYEHTPGDIFRTHATERRGEATMCCGSQPIREGVLSGVYPYSDRSIGSPK